MLKIHSVKWRGKDVFFLSYKGIILSLQPVINYSAYTLQDLNDLLLFDTQWGEYLLGTKEEADAQYEALIKKLPEGEITTYE